MTTRVSNYENYSETFIDVRIKLVLGLAHRIAELRDSSKAELEDMRVRKKQEKGGFEENLILSHPLEESFHDKLYPDDSTEFKHIVFKPEDAAVIEKHGVTMIYTTKAESRNAAVLYQETQKGHAKEFLHEKNDFIYLSWKVVVLG
jgi:hypothetical protein